MRVAPTVSSTTIIRPPARWPRPELGELWQFRAICMVLVRRSLMVRYRQTVVGAGWTLLQPLTMMVVFTVFFGILSNVSSDGVPYPVFVYSGLLIYQIVAKVLNEGSTSVVSNAALVNKIFFPRAYFPISVALASLVDLLFGMVAFAVLLVWYRIVPGWPVVLVPLFGGVAMLGVLGVTFWLSALNATYRDVAQLLPFISQLWMFISPVIYPSSIVPAAFRTLYWLNPMALAIDGIRWAFTGTSAPPPEEWLIGTIVAIVLMVTGYTFFRHREPTFSDVV